MGVAGVTVGISEQIITTIHFIVHKCLVLSIFNMQFCHYWCPTSFVCFFSNIFVTLLRRHCCDRGYIVSQAFLRTWVEDVKHSMSITPDCAKSHICWWAGEKAAVIKPWLCEVPTGGETLQRDSSSADGSKNLLSPWIPCNYKSIRWCFYLTHLWICKKIIR